MTAADLIEQLKLAPGDSRVFITMRVDLVGWVHADDGLEVRAYTEDDGEHTVWIGQR